MNRVAAALFISVFLLSTPVMSEDFNSYILSSVNYLYKNYKGGGYDINKAFTHDLPYGGKIVKASKQPLTMCVAAVTEVIIEAINIYAKTHPNVYSKLPVSTWTGGSVTTLRANIFRYKGTNSPGTGYALAKLGVGEELTFDKLKAGDFINFNRTASGHAVVFLNYIHGDDSRNGAYGDDIVGFEYFSAQGKGKPDAGFEYRDGYFEGKCPAKSKHVVDCSIKRSANSKLFNLGRMWDPELWNYGAALDRLKVQTRDAISEEQPDTRGNDSLLQLLVTQELNKPLSVDPDIVNRYDGVDGVGP